MGYYRIYNGPMPTTAGQAKVATGTSIKTMLQLKPFNPCHVVDWGCSFDGFSAALPGIVELLDTGTVFATVTASADADITKMDGVGDLTVASVAGLTMGTSATGYTSTVEGAITSVRMFDAQLIAPTNQYIFQFPLGERPLCIAGNAVRIRMTFGTSVNALCWIGVRF